MHGRVSLGVVRYLGYGPDCPVDMFPGIERPDRKTDPAVAFHDTELLVHQRGAVQPGPDRDIEIDIEHNPDIAGIHPRNIHGHGREMIFQLSVVAAVYRDSVDGPKSLHQF